MKPEEIVAKECTVVVKLVAGRTKKYDQGGIQLDDYYPLGQGSHFHEINQKFLRFKSGFAVASNVPVLDDVEDTCQDLIAELAFYLNYLRRK